MVKSGMLNPTAADPTTRPIAFDHQFAHIGRDKSQCFELQLGARFPVHQRHDRGAMAENEVTEEEVLHAVGMLKANGTEIPWLSSDLSAALNVLYELISTLHDPSVAIPVFFAAGFEAGRDVEKQRAFKEQIGGA